MRPFDSINFKASERVENELLVWHLAAQLLKPEVGSAFAFRRVREVEEGSYSIGPKDETEAAEMYRVARSLQVNVVPFWSTRYPVLFKNYPYPPALLFYKGDWSKIGNSMICFVGTRNSTQYGKSIVQELLSDYLRDHTIISGLAIGIDSEVHKRCLLLGLDTAAVVAAGIDQGFPRENKKLYDEICEKGGVISEFPPGKPVRKGMFPLRNRIMAGLAKAVVVVEASEKSGSLITARYALDYGKDVMAVPGSVFAEQCAGCNKLIREGAHAVCSAKDLADLIGIENYSTGLSREEDIFLKYFDNLNVKRFLPILKSGFTPEELCAIVEKPHHETVAVLTKMEMDCILSRNLEGKYILTR